MPAMNITSGMSIKGVRAEGRNYAGLLGGTENPYGETEPRIGVTFKCANEHVAQAEFHYQADLPRCWPCIQCGHDAPRIDPPLPLKQAEELAISDDHQPVRPGAWYTGKHRREVFTRRTREELEAVLAERLAIYRSTQPPHAPVADEGAA